jgi:hypothetical protein
MIFDKVTASISLFLFNEIYLLFNFITIEKKVVKNIQIYLIVYTFSSDYWFRIYLQKIQDLFIGYELSLLFYLIVGNGPGSNTGLWTKVNTKISIQKLDYFFKPHTIVFRLVLSSINPSWVCRQNIIFIMHGLFFHMFTFLLEVVVLGFSNFTSPPDLLKHK